MFEALEEMERRTNLPRNSDVGSLREGSSDPAFAEEKEGSATTSGSRYESERTTKENSQSFEVPTSLSILLRLDVPDVVSLGLGLLSVVIEARDVGLSPEVVLERRGEGQRQFDGRT